MVLSSACKIKKTSVWHLVVTYPARWSLSSVPVHLNWSSIFPGSREHRNIVQLCIKHLGKLGRRRGWQWQRPERNDKFWSWTDLWPSEAFAVPRPVADHSHHFGDDDHDQDCDLIMLMILLMIMTMKMMIRIMVMMMVSDHSSNDQMFSVDPS